MSRLMGLALAAVLAPGCAVQVPEGVFACTRDDQCPPGMTCDRGYCYRPDGGGPIDAPAVDASIDAPLPDDVPGLDAPDGGGCDPIPPTFGRSSVLGSDGDTEAHGALLRPGGLFLPLHYRGDLAPLGPSSGGFDGALAVLSDDDTVSSEGAFSGSGDAFLRAVTRRSGGGFYVAGEAFEGVQPPSGSPQAFAAGTTVAFLYRDDRSIRFLAPASGGLVRPLAVAERGDGSVCIGGVFRGALTVAGVTHPAQGDAGFVACWTAALVDGEGFVIDGAGDDSVDTLLADDANLYVGGTFTDGAGFPDLSAMPALRSTAGDGFVLRMTGGATAAYVTFGGTGAVASAVHALALGPADRLFAAGMLGQGSDPGLPVTHSGTGTDALLVALDQTSLVPRWAEVESVGFADRYRALVVDRCGRPVVGGALGGVSTSARLEELAPVVRGYPADGSAARWALDGSTGGIVRGMLHDDAGRFIVVGRAFGALSFVLGSGSSLSLLPPPGDSSVFVLELLD